MSKLIIRSQKGDEFKLNVTQFRSPMSAQISSVQTHTMLQHFPIRAGQPDIQFTVLFRSNNDKHDFQSFVRRHQVGARDDAEGEITLWWPQRNIENWTGYIMQFQVLERRFIYAPSAQFGVALVDSLLSQRTRLFSSGAQFLAILGPQDPDIYAITGVTSVDAMLTPPTMPSSARGGAGASGTASVPGGVR